MIYQENVMSSQIEQKKYFIKIEMKGAKAVVYINDIPILRNPDNEGVVTTEPANLWLKSGKNTLSYTVFPYGEIKEYNPSVALSVFLHNNKEDYPSPKEILGEIKLDRDKDHEYPLNKSIEFIIEDDVKTKLWNDAEKIINLSKKDKMQIISVIRELSEAILKDAERAIKLQMYKIEDDALAEGKSVEKLIDVASHSYEWLQSQKGVKLDNIDIDKIKFNICGDGQLINVIKDNGDEAIVYESEDMYFDIALYFSKINGKWTIVR